MAKNSQGSGRGFLRFLKRSLFLALLWRALPAAIAVAAFILWVPKLWMAAAAGLAGALWMAAQSTYAITNALEELEPMAAAVCDGAEPLPEPPADGRHCGCAECVQRGGSPSAGGEQ
jgi:hypothetical protein